MNILKKILVCGASLVMVASLGSGISNVSAKRVHGYHNRTHRTYRRHNHMSRKAKLASIRKQQYKATKHYLSIMKDYVSRTGKPHKDSDFVKDMNALSRNQQRHFINEFNSINRSVKSKRYRHHYRKHIKRNKRNHNSKHRISRKHIKKHARKHNKVKAPTLTNSNNTSSTSVNNASNQNNHSTSNSESNFDSPDYTDNGKYYTFNDLMTLLNSDNVRSEAETSDEENKIISTIKHYIDTFADGGAEDERVYKIGKFYKNDIDPVQHEEGMAAYYASLEYNG